MADSPSDEASKLVGDVALVRQSLMRELETINAYEAFAARAGSAEVRAFLAHLSEKEHVAEATALMRRLDPEQERIFQSADGFEHFQRGTGTHAHEGAGAARAPLPGLTVGSLRGVKP